MRRGGGRASRQGRMEHRGRSAQSTVQTRCKRAARLPRHSADRTPNDIWPLSARGQAPRARPPNLAVKQSRSSKPVAARSQRQGQAPTNSPQLPRPRQPPPPPPTAPAGYRRLIKRKGAPLRARAEKTRRSENGRWGAIPNFDGWLEQRVFVDLRLVSNLSRRMVHPRSCGAVTVQPRSRNCGVRAAG